MEIESTKVSFWEDMKAENTSFYTKPSVQLAERWGREMEVLMENGLPLSESVTPAYETANEGDVTGYQRYLARQLLNRVWVHGAALSQL